MLTSAQLPTNVITKTGLAGDIGKAVDASTGAPLTVGRMRTSPLYRASAYDPVMGTAPTISNGTSSTITNPILYTPANSSMRIEGGDIRVSSGNWIMYKAAFSGSPVQDSNPAYRVAFETWGNAFELVMFGSGTSSYRCWVDGQAVSLTPATIANDSVTHYIKHQFSTVAHRRIVLELTGYFKGINVGTTAWFGPPPADTPIRLAVYGDSYVNGGHGTTIPRTTGFVPTLARILGIPQVGNFGIGGSGFVSTSSGTVPPFGDSNRLDQLVAWAPTHLLVCNTLNDNSFVASYPAAAAAVFNQLATRLPNIPVRVSSVLFTGAQTTYASLNAAASTAAATAGLTYIDATIWFTGTGHAGATTGDGNADNLLGNDGVHPTIDGHRAIAERMAPELVAAFGFHA